MLLLAIVDEYSFTNAAPHKAIMYFLLWSNQA